MTPESVHAELALLVYRYTDTGELPNDALDALVALAEATRPVAVGDSKTLRVTFTLVTAEPDADDEYRVTYVDPFTGGEQHRYILVDDWRKA
jgi:hypothetical protein